MLVTGPAIPAARQGSVAMGPSVAGPAGPLAVQTSVTADPIGDGGDPLDGVPAGVPGPPGQADDLLSQLAGAEIDRMLAEADVEPALPPPPVLAAAAAPAITPAPILPVAPVNPPAAALPLAEPAAPGPPPVARPVVAVEPPPTETPAAVAVPVPSADLDAVLADAAAERSALRATPAPALPGVADIGPGAVPLDLGAPVARLPLALRPLAALNAPLVDYPDRVRDAIGKVAVVTLLNSLAVLTYVAVFRRHG